jgi:hypothetical protein
MNAPPEMTAALPVKGERRGDGKALREQDSNAALAAEINAEHERAFGKAREALEHAKRAGEPNEEDERVVRAIYAARGARFA